MGYQERDVPDTAGLNLITNVHVPRGKAMIVRPNMYLHPADVDNLPKKKQLFALYKLFTVKRWRPKNTLTWVE